MMKIPKGVSTDGARKVRRWSFLTGFMIKAFSLFGCIGSREERRGREGRGERPRAPFKAEKRPITGLEKPSRLWCSNHATFVASLEPTPLLSGAQRTGTTAQSREEEGDGWKGKKEGLRFACQSKVDQR